MDSNIKIITSSRFDPTGNYDDYTIVGYARRDLDTGQIQLDDGTDLSFYGICTDVRTVMNLEENKNYKLRAYDVEEIELDRKTLANGDMVIPIEYHLTVMMERR